MGLNMSWKKKFVCDILAKKLFVFDQGEKKLGFLLRKKNWLGRKTISSPPPPSVLNGPPLKYCGASKHFASLKTTLISSIYTIY